MLLLDLCLLTDLELLQPEVPLELDLLPLLTGDLALLILRDLFVNLLVLLILLLGPGRLLTDDLSRLLPLPGKGILCGVSARLPAGVGLCLGGTLDLALDFDIDPLRLLVYNCYPLG